MDENDIVLRDAVELYLDLLKKCLTRVLFPDSRMHPDLVTISALSLDDRAEGKDWPTEAETMIGLRRLDNLQACIVDVIRSNIGGDLVETGAWRGGASILMRAVLKAYADERRKVWVADSFEGLPVPDPERYPQDAGDGHHRLAKYLGVPLEEVKANFQRYGLLDEQVCFLPGWFRDTLPIAPVERIAVLRLDGDMYESTMQALEALYHRVSDGGYVIIDDYGALPNCRRAVEDFRSAHEITEPVFRIDWTGVFWQKGRFADSRPQGTFGMTIGAPEEPQIAVGDFNEEFYLSLHPDVAQAVRQRYFVSGKEHYLKYGRGEGRRSW